MPTKNNRCQHRGSRITAVQSWVCLPTTDPSMQRSLSQTRESCVRKKNYIHFFIQTLLWHLGEDPVLTYKLSVFIVSCDPWKPLSF